MNALTRYAATAAMLLPGAAAIAQEASSSGLEEIVVTAERREASLQSVPVAVSALSAETLENRQVTESADLQRFVPSLKMTNNITAPTSLSPSLRGSTVQDASLVVAESPFGIYVDDVYVGRLNGNNATLADISRVEVLRGPQGTLYGRNTLAGAIKFISRDPGDETWLDASLGAGNWDQYRASFSAGGKLGESDWAGSLAAQINNKDGQYRNFVTGQETGRERNWATRAKLRYMGIENFDAVLSVSYADSENDALQLFPGVVTTPPDEVFTSDDVGPPTGQGYYSVGTPTLASPPGIIRPNPSGHTEQLISSLNLSYDFGGVTLRSISAYVNTKDFFSTDFSGVGLVVGAGDADADQYTQELQLQGNAFDERLSYILGAFYLKEDSTQDFAWIFFTPASTSALEAETTSKSVFGQVDFNFTDALKATVGLRWTEDQKEFDISIVQLPTVIFPGGRTDPVSFDNTYDAWTPKFGLDYTFETSGSIDSLLTYVSAAKGFKSGGYNGIALLNLDDATLPYFPEENWTYEAGIKTDLFGRKLRINAAAFYNEIEDLQLNATLNGGASFPVQNAGAATIKGIELEVTSVPVDGLTLFANAAFMEGKFDELSPGAAPALAVTVYNADPEPPQVPDYSFTLGFDYGFDIPLGSEGGRVSFGADWFRSDDYVLAATNDFVIEAYDRVSAFAALGVGDSWEARFSVKNLTDEETVISGSRLLGGFILLPPREYLFSINYKL